MIKDGFIFDPSLVFYLPLYELDGDSFMSKDAYGHLCTVTGALWTLQGRYYDGVDDLINCGKPTILNNIFSGGGTVIAEINPDSDGESNSGAIVSKREDAASGWSFYTAAEAAGKTKLYFYAYFGTQYGLWVTDATVVTIGTFQQVAITYDSSSVNSNPIFYVNGVAVASSEVVEPIGTSPDDSAYDLCVGNGEEGGLTFDGLISDCILKRRILSPLEIQNEYLNNEWRYR